MIASPLLCIVFMAAFFSMPARGGLSEKNGGDASRSEDAWFASSSALVFRLEQEGGQNSRKNGAAMPSGGGGDAAPEDPQGPSVSSALLKPLASA
jgi:hypothetical protein